MIIEKYHIVKKDEWDAFIRQSRNATFLFFRDYMDYHSSRYTEHSLMIYDRDKLIALFPANLIDNTLISHGFLTYGGILVNGKIGTADMLILFADLLNYCRQNNIKEIIYKAIPYIYHSKPSEEDLYSLFRNEAKLLKREVSSCIYIPAFNPHINRKNGYNKAVKNNLILRESSDLNCFMEIANNTLNGKYGKNAVHTSEELIKLKEAFPGNIKFFGAYKDDILMGGAVIFENRSVVHAQYLHTSPEGKKFRCMDFIIISLIKDYFSSYTYFDFGHSTEDDGKYLNESLINQKEEFGASALCYDTYKLELKNE